MFDIPKEDLPPAMLARFEELKRMATEDAETIIHQVYPAGWDREWFHANRHDQGFTDRTAAMLKRCIDRRVAAGDLLSGGPLADVIQTQYAVAVMLTVVQIALQKEKDK